MAERIDPKGLKTLSDILALVLEDQPGESAAALEAVRRKARQDGVTGSALKDLFRQINRVDANLVHSDHPPSAPSLSAERLQAALKDMQRRFVEARLHLDRERRSSAQLRDRLRQLEHEAASRSRPMPRLGAFERHIEHAEELELQIQRNALDMQTMERELILERGRTHLAMETAWLRWMRFWQALIVMGLLIALAADSMLLEFSSATVAIHHQAPAGPSEILAL